MNRLERELERRLEARRRRGVCTLDTGGDDPPQPDPNIGAAARENAQLGRESLEFSKKVYEEGKPRQATLDALVDQVVKQQLRVTDKAEAASDDYINYMKTTFRPVEESLAKEAMEFDTEAKRGELAGKAGADVEQAAARSDAAARRDAARYGVNPSDAAFSENLAGSSLNKTILKVGAMGDARTKARAEGRALKFDVAAIGKGLPGAGATSSQIALSGGSAAVGNAAVPGAAARSDAELARGGFSTAIAGNQSAGSLYSNIFDAEMTGYQARQQAKAGMAQGVGTAVGLGVAAFI